jgi:hypothetical protein
MALSLGPYFEGGIERLVKNDIPIWGGPIFS